MTKESQFNEASDSAALKLKGDLSRQLGKDLPSKQVLVDSDGRPPKPLPPEGSYMRQQIEAQRRQLQSQQPQPIGDQPLAGTSDQAIDGSQAPPLTTPGATPQEPPSQTSPKAEQRIQELTQKLRAQEQGMQAATEAARQAAESKAELEQRLVAFEQERNQLLQANLENLDPETRMQVLQDARMRETLDGFKKQLLDEIMPHVQGLQQSNIQHEMMELSEQYPAFDIQIHGPLIDMFRGKNQHCSIEQAWKAVAEPGELVTREAASLAPAVPPVVPPGAGGVQPRYMPQPEPDQEESMIADARAAAELMKSDNPRDHRDGLRKFSENIAERLGPKLPGNRPSYR